MPVAANEVPLALAFGAGLVATVNPCGFAMLPSILSYYLGSAGAGRRGTARLGEGLAVGLVVTAGFVLLFGTAGIAVALGARAVVEIVPWVTIGVGAALIALGGWLLAGRHLVVRIPGFRPSVESTYRSMFLFGIAYAVGSLSCTLPVFLVVVSSALATGSVLGTVGVFLAYGLGMSTVLMLLCAGTAGFRELVVRAVRPLLPHIGRISGALLVLGGGYVVYYWATLLSGGGETGAVRSVTRLQGWAQDAILGLGEGVWLAAGIALLAAGALLVAVKARTGASVAEGETEAASEALPDERRRSWAGQRS